MALVNTMVGSVTLILPNNFMECGVVTSILIMIFIGTITYFSAKVIIVN